MKTITLSQIQNQAEMLKITQKITYNQALHQVSQQSGFKNYQAFLSKREEEYIADNNEQVSYFKTNVFKNRKHMESNFKKLEKLQSSYYRVKASEEDPLEELEEIENEAQKISTAIADMFFGNVQHKLTDNESLVDGAAFVGYTIFGDYSTVHNDIDGNNADYFIELYISDCSFRILHRELDSDGALDADWHELSNIYLP